MKPSKNFENIKAQRGLLWILTLLTWLINMLVLFLFSFSVNSHLYYLSSSLFMATPALAAINTLNVYSGPSPTIQWVGLTPWVAHLTGACLGRTHMGCTLRTIPEAHVVSPVIEPRDPIGLWEWLSSQMDSTTRVPSRMRSKIWDLLYFPLPSSLLVSIRHQSALPDESSRATLTDSPFCRLGQKRSGHTKRIRPFLHRVNHHPTMSFTESCH